MTPPNPPFVVEVDPDNKWNVSISQHDDGDHMLVLTKRSEVLALIEALQAVLRADKTGGN